MTRLCTAVLALALGLFAGLPAAAFTMEQCKSTRLAPGLAADAEAPAIPAFIVEPGLFNGDVTCDITETRDGSRELVVTETVAPASGVVAVYRAGRITVGVRDGEGTLTAHAWCAINPLTEFEGLDPQGFTCFADLFWGARVGFHAYFGSIGQFEGTMFTAAVDDTGIFAEQPDFAHMFPLVAEESRAVTISIPDLDLEYALSPDVPGVAYFLRSSAETSTLSSVVLEGGMEVVITALIRGRLTREPAANGGSVLGVAYDASDPHWSYASLNSGPDRPRNAVAMLIALSDAIRHEREGG